MRLSNVPWEREAPTLDIAVRAETIFCEIVITGFDMERGASNHV